MSVGDTNENIEKKIAAAKESVESLEGQIQPFLDSGAKQMTEAEL